MTITYVAPQPLKPAQVESYTLTCERGSQVFETQQVVVERGQVKQLERAAFGGSTRTPLRIAYRVAARARAQVTVLRGKKVVKRYKARTVAAKRTHRLKLAARKLAKRGDYRVRIVVGRGAGRVTSTLVSRKL